MLPKDKVCCCTFSANNDGRDSGCLPPKRCAGGGNFPPVKNRLPPNISRRKYRRVSGCFPPKTDAQVGSISCRKTQIATKHFPPTTTGAWAAVSRQLRRANRGYFPPKSTGYHRTFTAKNKCIFYSTSLVHHESMSPSTPFLSAHF